MTESSRTVSSVDAVSPGMGRFIRRSGTASGRGWRARALRWALIHCAVFCFSPLHAVELIANPQLGLQSLERDTLRSMFIMRLRRWDDGTPVRVFVLSDRDPAHREFSKKLLGVFPHQLRRSWDRTVFSGLGQAPTEVEDEAEMLKRVAETPGGVGYVSGPAEGADVSIVTVE
jgi:hypothetical protein